jgi:hypothetical protein
MITQCVVLFGVGQELPIHPPAPRQSAEASLRNETVGSNLFKQQSEREAPSRIGSSNLSFDNVNYGT